MIKLYQVIVIIELMKVITLFLSAFILIFYKFNYAPKNLCFDEVEFAKLALFLDRNSYIPYSSLATGHSTLYFYILLFSFKIFGLNNFALRLPAALFGVVNPLMFYFIIQKIFDKNNSLILKSSNIYQLPITNYLPLILSLIFLTSRWYFNFARFAFEVTFLLFLELVSIYFLLKYLKEKKTFSLILTLLFAGLAFNSYTPCRIFFILPFIFIVSRIIKQWNKLTMKQLMIGSFIFFVTVLPLMSYLISHPDIRFNQQFFLINSDLSLVKKAEFLGKNILKTFLMFFWQGDINGRHNYPLKPALNLVLVLFFFFGLTLSFKNLKNQFNQLFLIYFLLSLIPTLLTYPWENPNMLRTFTAIPSVVFFIGRSLEFILGIDFPRPWKSGTIKFLLIFFVLFLLILSSIYEIRTYFKYQTKVFEQAFEVEESLDVLIKNVSSPR